jgi:hypothetical protein
VIPAILLLVGFVSVDEIVQGSVMSIAHSRDQGNHLNRSEVGDRTIPVAN